MTISAPNSHTDTDRDRRKASISGLPGVSHAALQHAIAHSHSLKRGKTGSNLAPPRPVGFASSIASHGTSTLSSQISVGTALNSIGNTGTHSLMVPLNSSIAGTPKSSDTKSLRTKSYSALPGELRSSSSNTLSTPLAGNSANTIRISPTPLSRINGKPIASTPTFLPSKSKASPKTRISPTHISPVPSTSASTFLTKSGSFHAMGSSQNSVGKRTALTFATPKTPTSSRPRKSQQHQVPVSTHTKAASSSTRSTGLIPGQNDVSRQLSTANSTQVPQSGVFKNDMERISAWKQRFKEYNFYLYDLDAKERLKLKTQILALGGKVSEFMNASMTHFVSNSSLEDGNNKGHSGHQKSSLLAPPTASSKTDPATAFLLKNPHIKKWTVNKLVTVIQFLSPETTKGLVDALRNERIYGISTHRDEEKVKNNFIPFKGPYILVEEPSGSYRPIVCKEYEDDRARGGIDLSRPPWPIIYFNGPSSRSVFLPHRSSSSGPGSSSSSSHADGTTNGHGSSRNTDDESGDEGGSDLETSNRRHGDHLIAGFIPGSAASGLISGSVSTTVVRRDPAKDRRLIQLGQRLIDPNRPSQQQTGFQGDAEALDEEEDVHAANGEQDVQNEGPLPSNLKEDQPLVSTIPDEANVLDQNLTESNANDPSAASKRKRTSPLTKQRRQRKRRKNMIVGMAFYTRPGYCENCNVRYDEYQSHIRSKQHRSWAETESNFVNLDKLFNKISRDRRMLTDESEFLNPFDLSTYTLRTRRPKRPKELTRTEDVLLLPEEEEDPIVAIDKTVDECLLVTNEDPKKSEMDPNTGEEEEMQYDMAGADDQDECTTNKALVESKYVSPHDDPAQDRKDGSPSSMQVENSNDIDARLNESKDDVQLEEAEEATSRDTGPAQSKDNVSPDNQLQKSENTTPADVQIHESKVDRLEEEEKVDEPRILAEKKIEQTLSIVQDQTLLDARTILLPGAATTEISQISKDMAMDPTQLNNAGSSYVESTCTSPRRVGIPIVVPKKGSLHNNPSHLQQSLRNENHMHSSDRVPVPIQVPKREPPYTKSLNFNKPANYSPTPPDDSRKKGLGQETPSAIETADPPIASATYLPESPRKNEPSSLTQSQNETSLKNNKDITHPLGPSTPTARNCVHTPNLFPAHERIDDIAVANHSVSQLPLTPIKKPVGVPIPVPGRSFSNRRYKNIGQETPREKKRHELKMIHRRREENLSPSSQSNSILVDSEAMVLGENEADRPIYTDDKTLSPSKNPDFPVQLSLTLSTSNHFTISSKEEKSSMDQSTYPPVQLAYDDITMMSATEISQSPSRLSLQVHVTTGADTKEQDVQLTSLTTQNCENSTEQVEVYTRRAPRKRVSSGFVDDLIPIQNKKIRQLDEPEESTFIDSTSTFSSAAEMEISYNIAVSKDCSHVSHEFPHTGQRTRLHDHQYHSQEGDKFIQNFDKLLSESHEVVNDSECNTPIKPTLTPAFETQSSMLKEVTNKLDNVTSDITVHEAESDDPHVLPPKNHESNSRFIPPMSTLSTTTVETSSVTAETPIPVILTSKRNTTSRANKALSSSQESLLSEDFKLAQQLALAFESPCPVTRRRAQTLATPSPSFTTKSIRQRSTKNTNHVESTSSNATSTGKRITRSSSQVSKSVSSKSRK